MKKVHGTGRTKLAIKQEESLSITLINTPTIFPDHDEEDEPHQPKMWNLQDLFDSTNQVHLICLLAESENITFEKTVRDKKWKATMDEKIKVIERNEMWDLVEL